MLNKDFLRQILADQKSLLKLNEVERIEVPKYEELSVLNLYDKFKEDADLMRYFPDRLPKNRLPDRTYFFNILNTVYPDYTAELVRTALNNRHEVKFGDADLSAINVSDEWW